MPQMKLAIQFSRDCWMSLTIPSWAPADSQRGARRRRQARPQPEPFVVRSSEVVIQFNLYRLTPFPKAGQKESRYQGAALNLRIRSGSADRHTRQVPSEEACGLGTTAVRTTPDLNQRLPASSSQVDAFCLPECCEETLQAHDRK